MNRQRFFKWSITAGKLAVLVLLVWFVRATLIRALEDLGQRKFSWPWLALAGVFYILGSLPGANFWYRILHASDQHVTRYAAIRAFCVSQLGKYVPGKAMVILLRATLLRPQGVPTTLVAGSTIIETLTNMADGSLVAMLILVPQAAQHWKLLGLALIMLLITGLPIYPPIFKLAVRYTGIVKLNPSAINKLHRIPARTIAWGWATMAVGWWLQGLFLWAVMHSLGRLNSGPWENLPLHTAVAALSVVAGFLAFMPGGIGVREFVIIELFTPVYGDIDAGVLAILLRFVSVVSDVVVSIILYLIRPPRTAPGEQINVEQLETGSSL